MRTPPNLGRLHRVRSTVVAALGERTGWVGVNTAGEGQSTASPALPGDQEELYETHDIGLASLAASGSTLPEAVLERVPQADGVLLGPVSHYDYPPRAEGGINPSAELRTVFQL
ncbi:hypothetical protein ACWD4G_37745, partial [Streptomyces sp. NPDC002643]